MAQSRPVRAGEQRGRFSSEGKVRGLGEAVDGTMDELQAAGFQSPFDRPPADASCQELTAGRPGTLKLGDLVNSHLDRSIRTEANSPTIDQSNRARRVR